MRKYRQSNAVGARGTLSAFATRSYANQASIFKCFTRARCEKLETIGQNDDDSIKIQINHEIKGSLKTKQTKTY